MQVPRQGSMAPSLLQSASQPVSSHPHPHPLSTCNININAVCKRVFTSMTLAQYNTSTSTMALDAAADRGIIVVAKPRHTRDIDQTHSIFLLLLPGHAQPRPRHAYACSGTTESNPSGSSTLKSHWRAMFMFLSFLLLSSSWLSSAFFINFNLVC